MKIYFSAACQDVSQDLLDEYLGIVECMRGLGHQVIADHIVGEAAELYLRGSSEEVEFIKLSKKLLVGKHQCDLMVVEATQPSMSAGQEITYALKLNKPVVVLYQEEVEKPRLLKGLDKENLYVVAYRPPSLKKTLEEYIEYARQVADTRFNFFISPQIGHYLDWVAAEQRTPRAVFLRRLIEETMESDMEYQESGSR